MLDPSRTEGVTKGLVSIIIPAHQAEAFIERSVRSALDQTYDYVEVIVIENGSSDRTLEMVRAIQDKRLVILQSEKGVSNARNKGIENCNGEFMFFLDADDWLEQGAIESMMSIAADDVDLISARYFGNKPFETYDYHKYESGSEEYIIKCLCTPTKRGNCTGNLYRTEFIWEHGISFNPELSHAEDSVFFTKLLVSNPVVIDLERPIYHVFSNPESATRAGKQDNTDNFCEAIIQIYETLSGSNDKVRNAGYICAMNQLLVILVNSNKGFFELFRFLKKTSERDVFAETIKLADISETTGAMKLVFGLMKHRMYLFLTVVVKGRSFMNVRRRRKEING